MVSTPIAFKPMAGLLLCHLVKVVLSGRLNAILLLICPLQSTLLAICAAGAGVVFMVTSVLITLSQPYEAAPQSVSE